MAGEQEAPATDQVVKSRAGRDLPAAIAVGLGLAAAVVLTLLYWHWGFVLLVTAMLTLGTVELHDALKRIGMNSAIIPIVAGTVAVICGSYAAATMPQGALPWHSVLLGFLGATVLAALIWRMPAGAAGYVKDAAASLFTIGYIPLLGSFTGLILASPNGSAKMAVTLLIVMGTDTGGYAVGARLGKHPMAPQISPKKTWEGLAGSVGLAGAVAVPLTVWWLGSTWWVGLLLAVCIVAAGTCGDLIESLVKRDVGIKDMSSFLPGHGGAMDRLDSILVAGPVAWLIMFLLIPN
ncbi:phosphatidate cytidylyltransferase [Micropruina sonneratiae]|uniref:phosphatidate cytidylyltransferase n=1 Tax=Micropruina sonneratiae TaxID=2986940 RepID=UPI002227CD9D|nr:phosphatidate cytidylyltransferase [Micropruina sp. KQZ13P-5]MCW3157237.1 phosphatidate cytidylyltransferase [Micropruina sp. KQZ13P-5]